MRNWFKKKSSLEEELNPKKERIKLLEDNAFSDRARIGVLENELAQYKKQVFEEITVGLMPLKYYVDQVKRLEKAIIKLDKEVFPEED